MHFPGRILVVVAVFTVLGGCAQLGLKTPLRVGRPDASAKDVSESTTAKGLPDRQPAQREPLVADAELESDTPSPHDSATQLLIATELRDAAPQDRAMWQRQLNAIPSSGVALALRERRAGRTLGARETAPGTNQEHLQTAYEEIRAPEVSTPDADKSEKKKPLGTSLISRIGLPQILPDRGAPDVAETQSAPQPPPTTQPEPALKSEQPISPGAALWEDEVRKLIALLEADVSLDNSTAETQEQYIKRQVALRMLHLLANNPQQAQRVIPQLPPTEQEFWTNIFWGLSAYINNPPGDEVSRRAQTISQLQAAVYHLQQSAPLEVRQLAFCHRIDGFGSYEAFPQDLFTPGESVLLYCELKNFHSEPTAAGHYETRVRCSIEIIKPGEDLVVDHHDFNTTTDTCRVLRHDYYHPFRIDLPQLASGSYELRLRVEDEFNGKIASAALSFEIR